MPRRLDEDGTPRFDRRATDRHIASLERQLEDVQEQLNMLDRDGSRGHAVLLQRVMGNEQRSADLIAANERAHENIRREVESVRSALRHLGSEIERVASIQTAANVATLPERVTKLETDMAQRKGFQVQSLRVVGPYAGFVFGLATLIYTLSQAH